jgi:rod shape determining protein RodA
MSNQSATRRHDRHAAPVQGRYAQNTNSLARVAKVFARARIRDLDWPLVIAALVASGYGLAAIASATRGDAAAAGVVNRQATWLGIGVVAGVLAAGVHYHALARQARAIYVATVVILAVVVIVGHAAGGATRWLSAGGLRIQPSEFAKPVLVVALAAFWAARGEETKEAGAVLRSLAYAGGPVLLVSAQPDLGTALALAAIWAVIAVAAGARPRYLLAAGLAVAALFVLAWYSGLVQPYQKARLAAFVDPGADPLGTGYHVSQSKIAVGSGRLLGWGYGHGPQSRLDFIPAQHTDFVFTVIAEELGFLGALVLIALYAIIVWRCFRVADQASEALGRYLAAGAGGLISFQVIVNIGMTMGLMPVTGIPLPLVSYGGSSAVAMLIMLGLVEGVALRQRRLVF